MRRPRGAPQVDAGEMPGGRRASGPQTAAAPGGGHPAGGMGTCRPVSTLAGDDVSSGRDTMITAADDFDYPLLDLMWTLVLLFALVFYFWLLITVFADLFRRDDISGWAKTGWIVLVLVLPMIGALIYLVGQGRGMAERDVHRIQRSQEEADAYIRSVAAPGSRSVDEIARAKRLLDEGTIDQAEFEQLKRRALV